MELVKKNNGLSPEIHNKAKRILAFSKELSPQFYVGKSPQELQVELRSIGLLIKDIEPQVLFKMCELATNEYVQDKAKDTKLHFNIDYIFRFYKNAECLIRYGVNSFDDFFTKPEEIELEV